MADAATADAPSLSNTFNLSSLFTWHNFHRLHMLLMVGMVLSGVGMAAAMAGNPATIGDLAVGTLDAGWSMAKGLVENIGVIWDAGANALEGNFSPDVYEWGMMDHSAGMEHAGHAAPDVSSAAEAAGSLSYEFNSLHEWYEGLAPNQQLWMQEQAAANGQSLQEFSKFWCDSQGIAAPDVW